MKTTLESPSQRLIVDPALGGAVLRWDWRLPDGSWTPLFRPSPEGATDLYQLACFPLAPWANRVSAGGFEVAGRHYPLACNRSGEPFPIHGDAWLQVWSLDACTPDTLTMVLDSARPQHSPYRFSARQHFELLPDGLRMILEVRSLDAHALPYGLGFHPYFADAPGSVLQVASSGVWLREGDHLTARHQQPVPAAWSFETPRPVRTLEVDHCFTGWDGHALIAWPDRGLQLRMSAAPCSGHLQICRPAGADYLVFEPVGHAVDAFHLPGMPDLRLLRHGEALSLVMDLRVR